MQGLFNYTTLEVSLLKETKSLEILLNNPSSNHAINTEMLFELESILAWSTNKLEINSILISSTKTDADGRDLFSKGLPDDELIRFEQKKLTRTFDKLKMISQALFHLPQTIIMDIKDGATGVAAELLAGADIRIADEKGTITFDQLNYGMVPSCGGIGLLSTIVPMAQLRAWIMSSIEVDSFQLRSSGFISKTYKTEDRSSVIKEILEKINRQAPVQRIQAKHAFNKLLINDQTNGLMTESSASRTGLFTRDWKEAILAKTQGREPDFFAAKSFAEVAKQVSQELNS